MELESVSRFEWERLIRRAQIDATVMLTALVLATYANADGTRVKPGLARLTKVTGKSRATICRALAELRDLGLIDYTFQAYRDGRKGTADEYRLTRPCDLAERIPMLDPDEDQVSPMRPAALAVVHSQVSPMRPGDGETGSQIEGDRVSWVSEPGLMGETPPEQDQPIDQPPPKLTVTDGSLEGAKLSTGQGQDRELSQPTKLEIASWQAALSRETRMNGSA